MILFFSIRQYLGVDTPRVFWAWSRCSYGHVRRVLSMGCVNIYYIIEM